MIKVIRAKRVLQLINTSDIMQKVTFLQMKRSETLIDNKVRKPNGKLWGEDKLEDNNQIEFKVNIMYLIKLLRMLYLIALLVLFVAVIWSILVKQTYTDEVYSYMVLDTNLKPFASLKNDLLDLQKDETWY